MGRKKEKKESEKKRDNEERAGERRVQNTQQISFLFCLIFDFRQVVRADLLRGDGCTVYFCF